jgi:hypothetical protein
VPPANFGPLVAGGASGPFSVTFNPASLLPLTNQSLTITGTLPGFDSSPATNSPLVLPIEGTLAPPMSRPIRNLTPGPEGASMEIEGVSGLSYTILASTNLVDWEAIGASEAGTGGWFGFVVNNAAGLPWRFYRIVWP